MSSDSQRALLALSVPARQTVRLTVDHPERVTLVTVEEVRGPVDKLFLALNAKPYGFEPGSAEEDGRTYAFAVKATERLVLEVGNCSDEPMGVELRLEGP